MNKKKSRLFGSFLPMLKLRQTGECNLSIRVALFGSLLLIGGVLGFGESARAVSAIPNAPFQQGFGIDTPAGSGRHLATPSTTIYKVTNLNDSGPGSLRDALVNQDSPKVIIFEVSGNIELQSPIWVGGRGTAEAKGSYITVAGQTAPSPGITLKNKPVTIDRTCHDILIQHIRTRVGDELVGASPDMIDALTIIAPYDPDKGWYPPHNIVIDHCSLSWSIDELVETGADNITFSNNIFSEALNSPLHPKGPHSKGLMTLAYNSGVAGGKNTTIIKNLFAHNMDRNPLINCGSAIVANNLIYDHWQGIFTTDEIAKKGEIQLSVVGNYLIETDITARTIYVIAGSQTGTRIYLAGDNYFNGSIRTDPWSSIDHRLTAAQSGSDVPGWAQASSPPVWPEGYTTMSAADARTYVLANAGARPADRDSVDVRIVNDVKNGTGGIIASQGDVGGWPNLAKNTRALAIPANPNEVQASGYTKLEEWLHGFSRIVEGETEDTTPPSRSNPQPTGTLTSGTTSTTISLTTNETAVCKYGTASGVTFDQQQFTFDTPVEQEGSTGQATHSATVSDLEDGNSYTYYIRCQDESNNQNTDDFEISFSIASHTTYSISNFITLVTDWLKSETGLESDVNGDGVVNMRDLGIMMSNWSE